MVAIKPISESQALECIENGEFGNEILKSAPSVVIVLTQSWCPQWVAMQSMLGQFVEPGMDAWVFEYDQSDIFEKFMAFKETVLGNDQIPYLRYYRVGIFTGATNFVTKQVFVEKLHGNSFKRGK
jgi:hypothetical protein